MSRTLSAAALVLCLALAGCEGGSLRKEKPVERSEFYGVNAQFVLNGPEGSWDAHLEKMQEQGIGVVRFDALWDTAEPVAPEGGRHDYRWETFDAIAEHLAAHDLRWLPVIGYSAPWAGEPPGDRFAPPRNADFSAYAAAFAARYGRGGDFWQENEDVDDDLPVEMVEIWNEPDTERFWSSRDPARFAQLAVLSADAVKAAVPEMKVMLGGLTPGGVDFLGEMVRAQPGLPRRLDAVGSHPYAENVAGVLRNVAALRDGMRAAGLGSTPIHVTELGWPTQGSSGFVTSDSARARLTERSARRLRASDCGVEGHFPYTWLTLQRAPDDAEEWYGLYDVKVEASEAGEAYARAVASEKDEPIRACEG